MNRVGLISAVKSTVQRLDTVKKYIAESSEKIISESSKGGFLV